MSDMLTKLGIDWRLFIAQLVNFLVLFLVLRAFAWKPLLASLEERRNKVKKGVADAERAADRLKEIEREREETMSKTRAEAMRILEQAEQRAAALKDEKLRLAKTEIEQQLNDAKEMIRNERSTSFNSLKQDVAKLVAEATGKVAKQMDSGMHAQLVTEAIKDLDSAS